MNVMEIFPQEYREELILVGIPLNVIPPTPTQAQKSGIQVSPSKITRKSTPLIKRSTSSSAQQTPTTITHREIPSSAHSTSSSDMSNHTLESSRRHNIIILRHIYEKNEEENNAG